MIVEPVGQAIFPLIGCCDSCRREGKLHRRQYINRDLDTVAEWLCAICWKDVQPSHKKRAEFLEAYPGMRLGWNTRPDGSRVYTTELPGLHLAAYGSPNLGPLFTIFRIYETVFGKGFFHAQEASPSQQAEVLPDDRGGRDSVGSAASPDGPV